METENKGNSGRNVKVLALASTVILAVPMRFDPLPAHMQLEHAQPKVSTTKQSLETAIDQLCRQIIEPVIKRLPLLEKADTTRALNFTGNGKRITGNLSIYSYNNSSVKLRHYFDSGSEEIEESKYTLRITGTMSIEGRNESSIDRYYLITKEGRALSYGYDDLIQNNKFDKELFGRVAKAAAKAYDKKIGLREGILFDNSSIAAIYSMPKFADIDNKQQRQENLWYYGSITHFSANRPDRSAVYVVLGSGNDLIVYEHPPFSYGPAVLRKKN